MGMPDGSPMGRKASTGRTFCSGNSNITTFDNKSSSMCSVRRVDLGILQTPFISCAPILSRLSNLYKMHTISLVKSCLPFRYGDALLLLAVVPLSAVPLQFTLLRSSSPHAFTAVSMFSVVLGTEERFLNALESRIGY